jgi:hypothetical protein
MADAKINWITDAGESQRRVEAFFGALTTVDDVYRFQYDAGDGDGVQKRVRTKKGRLNCEELGIFADGTNKLSIINTQCAKSVVKSIEFEVEGGGDITVTGTVAGNGKEFVFHSGTRITGTCTLDNIVISAPLNANIFGPNVTLTNCRVSHHFFSVKWYGAKGLGNVLDDDAASINLAVQAVIKNDTLPRMLVFPKGHYYIGSPIRCENWDGTDYQFVTLQLVGSGCGHFTIDALATIIEATYKDSFAIGIHRGKSCEIEGLFIRGQFAPSFANYDQFCSTKYADYGGAHGCRETLYTPYSGVAIDYARSTAPSDGGWPGLSAIYRGPGGNGGSSACIIKKCRVFGFLVDVNYSSNGETQNCESMIIDTCALEMCKVAVSYGQDQTKNCVVKNILAWQNVHTVISCNKYGNAGFGSSAGCPPLLDTLDVAGLVNQLFDIDATNRFGFSANNIYAEGLFRIGRVVGMPAAITNSHLDFAGALQANATPDYYFRGANVTFNTVVMRNYDGFFDRRIHMKALGCTFINCQFDLPPVIEHGVGAQVSPNLFIDCKTHANGLGFLSHYGDRSSGSDMGPRALIGRFKQIYNESSVDTFQFASTVLDYDANEYQIISVPFFTLITCQVHADHTATLTLPGGTDASLYYQIGEYYFAAPPNAGTPSPLTHDTGEGIVNPVLGKCSAIASNVVTIKEVPVNWPVGTSSNWLIGQNIVKYITAPSFVGSSDDTVKNMPAAIKINSVYPPEYTTDPTNHSLNIQIMPGTVWESTIDPVTSVGRNRKFFFTKGGYLDASLHGGGARQAEWVEIFDTRINAGKLEYKTVGGSWITVNNYVHQTLASYTTNAQTSAYTGIDNTHSAADYANLTDINALRVAYENLRAAFDDFRTKSISTTIYS